MLEIDSPFTMIVAIVAVVMLTGVVKTYLQTRANTSMGQDTDADLAALRIDVERLKERVHVLERLATDKDRALADEISRLR